MKQIIGKVFLHELVAQCHVGCTAKERQAEQAILIDVTCDVDMSRAVTSDKRSDCVDYVAFREIVLRVTKGPKVYKLLEALAHEIAKQVLRLEHVLTAEVRIRKPRKLADVKEVGIVLQLSRSEV
jgi:dihydroneopterin aldolase